MSVVIDASITLSWYFEDERTPEANKVLDTVADHGAVVPALWKLEVANGFQSAIRRKRIDLSFRDNAIIELTAMAIVADLDTPTYGWTTTLRLADQFQLTPYDAAYLELAQRRKLPLATLDKALAQAARASGVPTLGSTPAI